jgi:hypothetical protein
VAPNVYRLGAVRDFRDSSAPAAGYNDTTLHLESQGRGPALIRIPAAEDLFVRPYCAQADVVCM